VAHHHGIVKVLELQQVHHVGDVGVEVDLRAGQVGAVAETGEADWIGVVPGRTQHRRDTLPRPCAEPGTGDQNEGRHAALYRPHRREP
jgi:hypothetical protein